MAIVVLHVFHSTFVKPVAMHTWQVSAARDGRHDKSSPLSVSSDNSMNGLAALRPLTAASTFMLLGQASQCPTSTRLRQTDEWTNQQADGVMAHIGPRSACIKISRAGTPLGRRGIFLPPICWSAQKKQNRCHQTRFWGSECTTNACLALIPLGGLTTPHNP